MRPMNAALLPVLHYVHDPLCGWCYGAAPLVKAARALPGLRILTHGGGMMTGARRQPVTEALRHYVMQHDRRIAAMTGQPFGDAYFNGLLRDSGAVFDSGPPSAAVLAAAAQDGDGLDLLARIQDAHYVLGLRVADPAVLRELAAQSGLDLDRYDADMQTYSGAPLAGHFEDSRALLRELGANGFPTFALQTRAGWQVMDPGRYLGQPEAWRDALAAAMRAGETQATPA